MASRRSTPSIIISDFVLSHDVSPLGCFVSEEWVEYFLDDDDDDFCVGIVAVAAASAAVVVVVRVASVEILCW